MKKSVFYLMLLGLVVTSCSSGGSVNQDEISVQEEETSQDLSSTWIDFENEDGKFKVKLPGKPTQSSTKEPTVVGDILVEMFLYEESSTMAYIVGYNDYPSGLFEGADDEVYQNMLDGGVEGFNKKVWTPETYSNDSTVGVKMTYLSVDGEEGYPGNLETTLWMELTADNTLRIRFESTTDKKTILNLTNHTYFNLGGVKRDAQDHEFQFWADAYTPVDEELIPTGEVKDVTGTPFDFRTPKILGDQIAANGAGFDHNMVMKREKSADMKHFVRVRHAESGRVMDMYSDNMGVQFYTGNFISNFAGADGKTYDKHWGFCLESQNWPDAINHDNFPSPILNPGEKYTHNIEYRFSVEK